MPPPPSDYITVCERNAELVAVKAEDTSLIASFTQVKQLSMLVFNIEICCSIQEMVKMYSFI